MEINTVEISDIKQYRKNMWDLLKRTPFGFLTQLAAIFGLGYILDLMPGGFASFLLILLFGMISITLISVQAHYSDKTESISPVSTLLKLFSKDFKIFWYQYLIVILFSILSFIIGIYVIEPLISSFSSSEPETVKETVNNAPTIISTIITSFLISNFGIFYIMVILGLGPTVLILMVSLFLTDKDSEFIPVLGALSKAAIKNNKTLSFITIESTIMILVSSIAFVPFVGVLYVSMMWYMVFRHIFMGNKLNQEAKEKINLTNAKLVSN